MRRVLAGAKYLELNHKGLRIAFGIFCGKGSTMVPATRECIYRIFLRGYIAAAKIPLIGNGTYRQVAELRRDAFRYTLLVVDRKAR